MTTDNTKTSPSRDAGNKLSKIHIRRLNKLADFLDKLPRKAFYYGQYVLEKDAKGCGTVACAIGWAPRLFPKLFTWHGSFYVSYRPKPTIPLAEAGMIEFGLTFSEYHFLFVPLEYDNPLTHQATPKAVAKHIRHFIARKLATK